LSAPSNRNRSSPSAFPGQYFDQETATHYNYFRDYDPAIGRYVQSDPIGLKGGVNTYGYVGSAPLKWADPRGLHAGTLDPGWVWPRPGDALLGVCRAVGMGLSLMLYPGRGDACSDDPKRERDECRPKDSDFCHKRWEKEDARCSQWSGLGSRAVNACRDRASDRRTLCIRNGGSPNPDEPPEYNPFVDYPR
jgi:RHS repeat-associated protein